MLTEEEIMSIRNRAKLSNNRQIDIIPFARQVERAVIDKLIQQADPESYYVIDPRGPNENGDYYMTGADIQNLITSKK